MRQLPIFILLAVAVSLGGCASSATTGICARVSDLDVRHEFVPPLRRSKSPRHMTVPRHRPSHKVAALSTVTKDESPEPRPTSPEWWMRENARLGKAIIICRGCLPASVAIVSTPKPAVLPSDLQAYPSTSPQSTSMNHVEGSIETPARP